MPQSIRLTDSERRRLLSSPPDGNLVQALRVVIRASQPGGWLTIREAAKIGEMSVRSFQRKLAAEGVVFGELVDEVRVELAVELLNDADASFSEIATALGYSSAWNFARAFQRWTGETPSEFRRGL